MFLSGAHHGRSALQYRPLPWLCLHGSRGEPCSTMWQERPGFSVTPEVLVSSLSQAADDKHLHDMSLQLLCYWNCLILLIVQG